MNLVALEIPDVKVLRPPRFGDARGFFSEIYNRKTLTAAGIATEFVQDNCSFSATVGTIRGLHFQFPPMAQAKLVMVLKGRVLDVAVDCRTGSPTYGRHVRVELDSATWNQMFVPVGFAHGFCTLAPDTLVLYKVTALYAPEVDSGILWNDPDLGIEWPVTPDKAVVSDKDRKLPSFRSLGERFRYVHSA